MCGFVACKDNSVRPVLGVSTVNDIEEQLSVSLVEHATPYFVDNEAGRYDQPLDNCSFSAMFAGFNIGKAI